jgi:MerR family transcriptional regulator/heat shock protein HspR
MMDEIDQNTPLFAITVAAELAGMHPQTLRQYDRMGLVKPTRTLGQSRRYTMRNVAQLREIARLSNEGVSLEGIRRVLELENQNAELRERVRDLERELANQVMNQPGSRVFAAGEQGIVRLNPGERPERNGQIVLWRRR